jgi:uncharacterized protein
VSDGQIATIEARSPTASELPVEHADGAKSILAEELGNWLRNDTLHLIVLPTEHCNFRCTYCYEDFLVGRMAAPMIEGVKRLIDRRIEGLAALTISWFGGEPLLAVPVVEEISEHIVAVAKEHSQLQYEGDMTTNGYFLDVPMLERLVGLGIRSFQVSLDGPESVHDRTRVRADGGGSFRRIWANLVAIHESAAPITMLLRVHLTPENLPVMAEFLSEIRETFLSDQRFRLLLKPVERLGGPNDESMRIVPPDERGRIMWELEGVLLQGATVSRPLYTAPEICYASRPNSFVIRANGNVGKCTVGLTDPANRIGRLSTDGLLEIDNARLRPWLRGWTTLDSQSLACPYGGMVEAQSKLIQVQRQAAVSPDRTG